VKVRTSLVLRSVFLIFPLCLLPQPSHAAIHARHVVGNNPAQCPRAQFTKIQDAVNAAAPGDEIFICNGIYPEQLTINKPLDIDADIGARAAQTPVEYRYCAPDFR
jgi:pectin methylesterase-like acyl-CoA thioesterase